MADFKALSQYLPKVSQDSQFMVGIEVKHQHTTSCKEIIYIYAGMLVNCFS
jgi:hypothetical protein